MAECNSDVLNYIVPPGSENLLLSLIVDNLICSFFCKPNPPSPPKSVQSAARARTQLMRRRRNKKEAPWASGTLRYEQFRCLHSVLQRLAIGTRTFYETSTLPLQRRMPEERWQNGNKKITYMFPLAALLRWMPWDGYLFKWVFH